MSNPTWNWLVILAPWSRLIFPVCSFLTCRRSVKRRWGAFNTDSPRSCLLDKIRRHLCDNALPFQNYLEFGLTGIPVHKRVKKPRFEIFESESYVKNIFTNYVISINKAENDICFNVLKKSLFMSFIGLKYSEADNTTVGIFQIKYCQPISKINNKILTVTDRTHIFWTINKEILTGIDSTHIFCLKSCSASVIFAKMFISSGRSFYTAMEK